MMDNERVSVLSLYTHEFEIHNCNPLSQISLLDTMMNQSRDYVVVEEMFPDDFPDGGTGVGCDDGELDTQISTSPFSGYQIPISEDSANFLYTEAGREEPEVNNETVILPSPHMLTSSEEEMIQQTAGRCLCHLILTTFRFSLWLLS